MNRIVAHILWKAARLLCEAAPPGSGERLAYDDISSLLLLHEGDMSALKRGLEEERQWYQHLSRRSPEREGYYQQASNLLTTYEQNAFPHLARPLTMADIRQHTSLEALVYSQGVPERASIWAALALLAQGAQTPKEFLTKLAQAPLPPPPEPLKTGQQEEAWAEYVRTAHHLNLRWAIEQSLGEGEGEAVILPETEKRPIVVKHGTRKRTTPCQE